MSASADAGSTAYHNPIASASAINCAREIQRNGTAPQQQARYGSTAETARNAGKRAPANRCPHLGKGRDKIE